MELWIPRTAPSTAQLLCFPGSGVRNSPPQCFFPKWKASDTRVNTEIMMMWVSVNKCTKVYISAYCKNVWGLLLKILFVTKGRHSVITGPILSSQYFVSFIKCIKFLISHLKVLMSPLTFFPWYEFYFF